MIREVEVVSKRFKEGQIWIQTEPYIAHWVLYDHLENEEKTVEIWLLLSSDTIQAETSRRDALPKNPNTIL